MLKCGPIFPERVFAWVPLSRSSPGGFALQRRGNAGTVGRVHLANNANCLRLTLRPPCIADARDVVEPALPLLSVEEAEQFPGAFKSSFPSRGWL